MPGPKFEITADTTLAELAGIMRLLPEFELRVRINPGFIRTQRYELQVVLKEDKTGIAVRRSQSLYAAIADAMESALAHHISQSSPPGEEE
jgi:hypothetical protein